MWFGKSCVIPSTRSTQRVETPNNENQNLMKLSVTATILAQNERNNVELIFLNQDCE